MNANLAISLPPGDRITVRDALDFQVAQLGSFASLDDARRLIAREHYFGTWDHAVAAGDTPIDRGFEAAADAIVTGDLAGLTARLDATPELVRARSAYGHHQTLLHHVAQNGIESTRQRRTPANACDIARLLLERGSDPEATCDSYHGGDTVLTLLCSSAHPAAAGLQPALVETLVTGGAKPTRDALWTAIVWGYPDAVDVLVRLGAPIDNLVLAAGAGDLERVRALVDAPRTDHVIGTSTKTLDAAHLLEYALIYAANCNRRDVVAFLLTRDPDLTIREPCYDATALGVAAHEHPAAGRPHGHREIVELLSGRRSGS